MYKNILILSLMVLLSSCLGNYADKTNPISKEKSKAGLFSKDASKGINLTELFAGKKNLEGGNINVNGFLWRASLGVLSIAPLISTDALGGTIVTDWYVNNDLKNQRLKITAYVLSSELRSDGIKITVHIQNFKDKMWSDTNFDEDLANKIEENILNEARILRLNSLTE